MYNQDLKLKFILEYTQQTGIGISTASAFLKASEAIEKEFGKDLCTISAQDLKPYVKRLFPARRKEAAIRKRFYAGYAEWCIKNHVPGACDALEHISTDEIVIEKVFTRTVSGPVHLQKYLDQIFYPVEEQTIDNVYRVYLWLAFGGMAEDRIFEITPKDIDLEEMYADFKGTYPIPLYRESIPVLKSCMQSKTIKVIRPTHDIYLDRCEGNQLLRGTVPAKKSTVRLRISRALARAEQKDIDLRLGYHGAWISGVFYRMYERERAGFPVDFKPVALMFVRNRGKDEYRIRPEKGKEKNMEYYVNKISREYERDYINWKKSFLT